MTQSTTTTLSKIVGTYIRQEFYGYADPALQLFKDATKYKQPKGAGKTAQFPRMRPLAVITSATSEGDNPTAVALTTDAVNVTMAKLTNAVDVTKESWQTGIKALSAMVGKKLRKNYNRSLTRDIQGTLAKKANRSRIDLNPAYQVAGTFTTGSLTVPADTGRGEADDFWTGGLLLITSGPGAGQQAQITDFANSGGVFTATFAIAPTTASTYKAIVTPGINASMPFSTDAFIRAVYALQGYQAEPRQGSMWKVNIDPAMMADMKKDSVFINSGMYTDTKKLESGLRGFWFETLIGLDSEGWYEAVGTQANGATEMGTYAATGAVHTAWFYGADAFGCVAVEGEGEGLANVNFYNIMEADSNNNTLAYTTHSWDTYFASVVPYGPFVHGISCGTAQGAVGENFLG